MLLKDAIQAPIYVQKGFVKKIRINVPWQEILSKPCEVFLDDVHIICDSPSGYDKEYAMRIQQNINKIQFDKLLKQFKEKNEDQDKQKNIQQNQKEDQQQLSNTSQMSYVQKIKKIIDENLRISVKNIHVRFEDQKVSRIDSSFNFGLTIDNVILSSTNNKFERVFIDIEEKKREKRQFFMLEINQFAVYWNSNVNDNWTQNIDFQQYSCSEIIEFSKKYTENLKKKYYQFQQNNNQNQVYLIQPFDINIKIRSNLNQIDQPTIPLSTQNIDISQLLVTIDEEVCKDMQYLIKFWSWHSSVLQKNLTHFKYRPSYKTPIIGNAKIYWIYAIKSTIYYQKKNRKQKSLQSNNQINKMLVELCELYKLKQYNQWVIDSYSQNTFKEHLILTVDLSQNFSEIGIQKKIKYSFNDLEELNRKIFELESKTTPEKMIVAFTKAEKDAEVLISEEKKKKGWSTWLSTSVMSMIGYSQQPGSSLEMQSQATQQDIQEIQKMNEMIKYFEDYKSKNNQLDFQPKSNEKQQENMYLSGHLSVTLPTVQLSLVNRSMHQFGSKNFLMIVINDIFFQQLSQKSSDFNSSLVSIKNFEIIDRLLNQQKFSRLIQKKEQSQNNGASQMHQDSRLQHFRIGNNNQILRQQILNSKNKTYNQDSLSEIEEETNPYVNNGMNQIQEYNRLKGQLEMHQNYFLVFQIIQQKQKIKNDLSKSNESLLNLKSINVNFMITNLQIFYNRQLIQRTQSFANQIRLNRVQNAYAEADFDKKMEKLKSETQLQVAKELEKSEIYLNCNLKSIEILIPDNTNYEMSKFLILQTGDMHCRSEESKRLNLFFRPNNIIDKIVKSQFNKAYCQNNELSENKQNFVLFDEIPQKQIENQFSFIIYDFKILYIPTVDQLENFLFNDAYLVEIDKKYSVLKKMDIIFELVISQVPEKGDEKQKHQQLKIGIGQVEIKLTNKEIQQLKDFVDNTIKYHDEIAFELSTELLQIQAFNYGQKFVQNQKIDLNRALQRNEKHEDLKQSQRALAIDEDSLSLKENNHLNFEKFQNKKNKNFPSLVDIYGQVKQQNSQQQILKIEKNKSFKRKDSASSFISAASQQFDDTVNNFEKEISSDQDLYDQFEDAHDYFDTQIIEQIKKLIDESKTKKDKIIINQNQKINDDLNHKKNTISVSVCMPKLKIQILEAQDLEKELMIGIKDRVGSASISILDLKFKGIPFLEFEFNKIDFRFFKLQKNQGFGFFIKDVCIINFEKRDEARYILSSSFSNDDFHQTYDVNGSVKNLKNPQIKNNFKDPEIEDVIQEHSEYYDGSNELISDQADQFLEIFMMKIEKAQKVQVVIGQTDIEINDSLIRKVFECIILDMPENQYNKYNQKSNVIKEQIEKIKDLNFNFKCSSLNTIIRDKKDFMLFKLLGINIQKSEKNNGNNKLEIKLRDIQIIQDDYEIILKHHCGSNHFQSSLYPEQQYVNKFNKFAKIDDDKSIHDEIIINEDQQSSIFKYFQQKTNNQSQEFESESEIIVQDLLLILDFKRLLKIVQILKSFESQILNIYPNLNQHQNQQMNKNSLQQDQLKTSNNQNQSEKKQSQKIKIFESYVQLPAREGKNSLFFLIENLQGEQTRCGQDKIINISDNLTKIFVATQFDLTMRYDLICIKKTMIKSLDKSLDIQIQKIKIQLNENYILLLSKLIDENIYDLEILQSKFKNQKDESKISNQNILNVPKKQQNEIIHDAQQNDYDIFNRQNKYSFEKLFDQNMESIQKIIVLNEIDPSLLSDYHNKYPIKSTSIQNISIARIKVDWVFGLSFDDHQENFVTLNNRNQTKIILQYFEDNLAQNQQMKFNKLGDINDLDRFSNDNSDDKKQGSKSSDKNKNHAQFKKQSFQNVKSLNSFISYQNTSKNKNKQINHQLLSLVINQMNLQQMVSQKQNVDSQTDLQTEISENMKKNRYSHIFKINQVKVELNGKYNFQVMSINPKLVYSENASINKDCLEIFINKNSEINISEIDLRICQLNAQILSNFTKSIYSCKNVLYKGRRKILLAQIFKVDQQQKNIQTQDQIERYISFQIDNFRAIIFDSKNIENHFDDDLPRNIGSRFNNFNRKDKLNSETHLFGKKMQNQSKKQNFADNYDFHDDCIDEVIKEDNLESDDQFNDRGLKMFQNKTQEREIEDGQIFSSLMCENEHNRYFENQFQNQLLSFDSIHAKSAFIINFKVAFVQTSNPQVIQDHYDKELFYKGLNKIQLLSISNFQLYQNNFTTNLREISLSNNSLQRSYEMLTILHPTNIILKKGFFNQLPDYPKKSHQNIDVSTFEFEISLKQVFKLKLLLEKIDDRIQPLKQIIEHQRKKNDRISKEQEIQNFKLQNNIQYTENNIQHNHLSVNLSEVYLNLNNEIGESILYSQEYGQNSTISSQFTPLFSLESKNITIKSQKYSDGTINRAKIIIPFKVFYFNQNLTVFEPFIEKTMLQIYIDKNKKKQTNLSKIEFKELMNINFSVQFYDSIFSLLSNLNIEQNTYNQKRNSYLMEEHKNQQQNSQNSQKENKKKNKNEIKMKKNVQDDKKIQSSSYFVKNHTGEIILFKTLRQKVFQELQPDEEYPLDFQILQNIYKNQSENNQILKSNKNNQICQNKQNNDQNKNDSGINSESEIQSQFSSDSESQQSYKEQIQFMGHYQENDNQDNLTKLKIQNGIGFDIENHFNYKDISVKSLFRRKNYRFLKCEPKKVFFQILIQFESKIEKTSVFEINIESTACQKIFLDDQKEFYIICQTQQSDGKKYLIIRSPMQICNNLQIPLQIILSNQGDHFSKQRLNMGSSLDIFNEPDEYYYSRQQEIKRNDLNLKSLTMQYEMLVKPQQSIVIPLRACGFQQVQIIPLQKQTDSLNRSDKKFEFTEKAIISLLKDEYEIFEQKPIILESKMLRKNNIIEQKNNKIYFVLNSNTYSIRSYVDYNTQQTEFISMRYLSISPPFVFQNLIPAPLTLFFRNILRQINQKSMMNFKGQKQFYEEVKDKKLYDLDLKHNSELQVLFLNPLGNFDFSILIPGYEESNILQLKGQSDEDFKICEEIKKNEQTLRQEINTENEDFQQENKKLNTKFRFIQQKTMLFCLVSEFQNQFNICTNVAFIQGQYQLTFYSKYWLLNNTLMPLEIHIKTQSYKFDKMSLPYENQEFDFDTIKHFEDQLKSSQNDGKKFDKGSIKNKNEKFDNQQIEEQKKPDDHQSQIETKTKTAQSTVSFSKVDDDDLCHENLKKLIEQQKIQTNHRSHFGRIKPWESYKFQQQEDAGLLGLLTQQEIDSVHVVYFTQEDFKDDSKSEIIEKDSKIQKDQNDKISIATSQNEQKILQALKRSTANLNNFDQHSMISKTSIQMLNFQENIDNSKSVPLIHTELSEVQIYSAPLKDQSQLKRIMLFSDNPINDEQQVKIQNNQNKKIIQQKRENSQNSDEINQGQTNFFDDIQYISMKICESDWTDLPFNIAKLQGESILLRDKSRKYCTSSMYELVANIQYLPHPFSFSKIIEFKSRYMIINKCHQTIQIIQADCEEKGMFKVYPFETSNFHWTDSQKPQEINVKFEDHEYSGNIKIDGIGDMVIRLRGTFENESIILNISITEERRTFFIIFSDVSYAPPYRIENLTKTAFKISQMGSRINDFDILKPYMIIPYAWSYIMNEKLLKISICSSSNDENLGSFKIDQINKMEKIILEDRKNGRQFLLEILNEKSLKIIRISYTDEFTKNEIINQSISNNEKIQTQTNQKYQLQFKQLGISVINSQARELIYVFIKNLKVIYEKQFSNKTIELKLEDFQIDNQLVRKDDEIIIRRDNDAMTIVDSNSEGLDLSSLFLNMKFQFMQNDTVQNLYFFKYFYFMITPLNLNLDGNFCDEIFKYGSDIIQQTRKYQALEKNQKIEFYEKDLNEIDKIKMAFSDLKNPYNFEYNKNLNKDEENNAQKKIYFEELCIQEIKVKFSFKSSPIMFREFAMNPTMKFLIVLMSNLKKVQLKFTKFQIQQQQQLISIFFAQMKRHYLQECYNHQQILQLISSMGLFGNISESLNNLSNAIESLVYHPFHEDDLFKGIVIGGALFVKQSISAITGPFFNIFESFKLGISFIFQYGKEDKMLDQLSIQDRNLFDDDIDQITKELNDFGTPLNAIDTQNRIWFRIIIKEKQNQDLKRKYLIRKQNDQLKSTNQMRAIMDSQNQNIQEIEGLDIQKEFSDDQIDQQTVLQNFERRRNVNGSSKIYNLSSKVWGKVTHLPAKLITKSAQVIDNYNTRLIEDQLKNKSIQKIRPPRFTSFTMQLEPYNLKKAYSLEILNDINLKSVFFQTESIIKLFALEKYVIILTAKRLICVQEINQIEGDLFNNNLLFRNVQKKIINQNHLNKNKIEKKTEKLKIQNVQDEENYVNMIDEEFTAQKLIQKREISQDIGFDYKQIQNKIQNQKYQDWNIKYDDIMKLKFEKINIEDIPRFQNLSSEEKKQHEQQLCLFNLRILYTESEDQISKNKSQKYANKGRFYEQNMKRNMDAEDSLVSDLRIGSKNIYVQGKFKKQIKNILSQIKKRCNVDVL